MGRIHSTGYPDARVEEEANAGLNQRRKGKQEKKQEEKAELKKEDDSLPGEHININRPGLDSRIATKPDGVSQSRQSYCMSEKGNVHDHQHHQGTVPRWLGSTLTPERETIREDISYLAGLRHALDELG